MVKIILDTDIGDDVDDALALGLILASKEFELLGVSTVFRNTQARAKQALTILKVAGARGIPVSAGCGASISPYVDYEPNPVYAYLNNELPNQYVTCLPESELPEMSRLHGVDLIIETILDNRGEVDILTIGAMTNLAMAMIKEPRIRSKIRKVVAMAGCFEERKAEWNIRCDPVAAEIVARSGIPVDFVGLDVTLKVELPEEYVDALGKIDNPLAEKLYESVGVWQAYIEKTDPDRKLPILPILHDPLAAITFIEPSVVDWRRGEVSVVLDREGSYGVTLFEEKNEGPHRYAYKVDSDKVISLWFERIKNYTC